MNPKEFREASERRKKGELDEIEDAARNEISRRFGEGDVDSGAASQQVHQGSSSLRSDRDSDSLRRDVQESDANPDATDHKKPEGESDKAA